VIVDFRLNIRARPSITRVPVDDGNAPKEGKRRAGAKECTKCQLGLEIVASKKDEKYADNAAQEGTTKNR